MQKSIFEQQVNNYKTISDGYLYSKNHRYQSGVSQNSMLSKKQDQAEEKRSSKMKIIDTSPRDDQDS